MSDVENSCFGFNPNEALRRRQYFGKFNKVMKMNNGIGSPNAAKPGYKKRITKFIHVNDKRFFGANSPKSGPKPLRPSHQARNELVRRTMLRHPEEWSIKNPPMCNHNQACKLSACRKEGPNQHRAMWVCAKEKRTRCKTFLWDDRMSVIPPSEPVGGWSLQSPPSCPNHKKHCIRYRVKKSGPKFGRSFWRCQTHRSTGCPLFMFDTVNTTPLKRDIKAMRDKGLDGKKVTPKLVFGRRRTKLKTEQIYKNKLVFGRKRKQASVVNDNRMRKRARESLKESESGKSLTKVICPGGGFE